MTNDNLIGEKKMSDIIRDDDTSILKKQIKKLQKNIKLLEDDKMIQEMKVNEQEK